MASQSAPKSIDSANWSVGPLPAPLSQLSPLTRDFVSIGLGKYLESKDFISDNPSILAQKEIDALIAEASAAEKAGQPSRSQTCIHQALLLRKCAEVGLDNFGPLFRNLTARDSKTRENFLKDVKKVHLSIQGRAVRAPPQNQEPPSGSQGHTDPRFWSQSGPTAPAGKMAMSSIDERSQNVPNAVDHYRDESYPLSRIVSGPAEPLPTLHEGRMVETRRIVGTSGNEERLDHREFCWTLM